MLYRLLSVVIRCLKRRSRTTRWLIVYKRCRLNCRTARWDELNLRPSFVKHATWASTTLFLSHSEPLNFCGNVQQSVQSNSAKGRIADLSPLAAAALLVRNSSSGNWTSTFVLVILGRKCTLAASRAAPGESRWVYAARPIKVRIKDGTDARTDGRTPVWCITLILSNWLQLFY